MKMASEWIDALGLVPHVEGGYYREMYRSGEVLPADVLPQRYSGPRCFSTAIYFLLKSDQVSRLHRLRTDEIWHFYAGSPLTLHLLTPDGEYQAIHLGADPDAAQCFQAVIPAGVWFGATVDAPDSFTLVGCTVAPGFDFADFELGRREKMLAGFPQHADLLKRLTAEDGSLTGHR